MDWAQCFGLNVRVLDFCDSHSRHALRCVCTATRDARSPDTAALVLLPTQVALLETRLGTAIERGRWWGLPKTRLVLPLNDTEAEGATAFLDMLRIATRLLPGLVTLQLRLFLPNTPWLSVAALLWLVQHAAPSVTGVQTSGPTECCCSPSCAFPTYRYKDRDATFSKAVPLLEDVTIARGCNYSPVFPCAKRVGCVVGLSAEDLAKWLVTHAPKAEFVCVQQPMCPGCAANSLPQSARAATFLCPSWCAEHTAHTGPAPLPHRSDTQAKGMQASLRVLLWDRGGMRWADATRCTSCLTGKTLRPRELESLNKVPAWLAELAADVGKLHEPAWDNPWPSFLKETERQQGPTAE